MAKLNRIEVIEELKKLREGDVLIGGTGSPWFTEGVIYPVNANHEGNLYIRDRDGDEEFINYDDDYDCDVLGRLMSGNLILPKPKEPFLVELASYDIENLTDYTVTLRTDSAGFMQLEKLINESMVALELPKLLAQKAHIEKQIEELTKGAN